MSRALVKVEFVAITEPSPPFRTRAEWFGYIGIGDLSSPPAGRHRRRTERSDCYQPQRVLPLLKRSLLRQCLENILTTEQRFNPIGLSIDIRDKIIQ